MRPSDRAAVEGLLHDMDAEGAARELCLLLRLDRDAEDLISWAIEESFKNGVAKGKADVDEPYSDEAWA